MIDQIIFFPSKLLPMMRSWSILKIFSTFFDQPRNSVIYHFVALDLLYKMHLSQSQERDGHMSVVETPLVRMSTNECFWPVFIDFGHINHISIKTNDIFGISITNWVDLYVFQNIRRTFIFLEKSQPWSPSGMGQKMNFIKTSCWLWKTSSELLKC